jgi:hypothetical protein
MLQGMFGKRLAEHFSLLESSSLVLGPMGNPQVALTRMRMPNGFPGPTPHIPPEKAFSISVHLRRPDSIKGWGQDEKDWLCIVEFLPTDNRIAISLFGAVVCF